LTTAHGVFILRIKEWKGVPVGSQNESMMEFACRFAEEIQAKAILLYGEVAQDLLSKKGEVPSFDTILITFFFLYLKDCTM